VLQANQQRKLEDLEAAGSRVCDESAVDNRMDEASKGSGPSQEAASRPEKRRWVLLAWQSNTVTVAVVMHSIYASVCVPVDPTICRTRSRRRRWRPSAGGNCR